MWPALIGGMFVLMLLLPCAVAFFGGKDKDDFEPAAGKPARRSLAAVKAKLMADAVEPADNPVAVEAAVAEPVAAEPPAVPPVVAKQPVAPPVPVVAAPTAAPVVPAPVVAAPAPVVAAAAPVVAAPALPSASGAGGRVGSIGRLESLEAIVALAESELQKANIAFKQANTAVLVATARLSSAKVDVAVERAAVAERAALQALEASTRDRAAAERAMVGVLGSPPHETSAAATGETERDRRLPETHPSLDFPRARGRSAA